MMSIKIIQSSCIFLCLAFQNYVRGQDTLTYNDSEIHQFQNAETFLTSFGIGSVIAYSYLSQNYKPEVERIPFHFTNDFASYLQMDKMHHIFGSYWISFFGYQYLQNCGIEKRKALLLSAPLGFLAQTPKEFIDGKMEFNGFSWGDVLSNAVGPLFFAGQEMIFNEQIVKYKFSFSKSEYYKQSNGMLGNTVAQSYFKDYNSHTYWLSFNINRIILKNKLPGWINIAAGYSANGLFGAYENPPYYEGVKLPETQRYRQFLFSLDIDWPEIKTRSKFLKKVLNTIAFIKLPFPAIEYNSKGQFKGYWLYF